MFPNAFPTHIGPPLERKHSNAPRLIPVSTPSEEFISVYDYQTYLRIKEQVDPDAVADKIQAAREVVESYLNYVLMGTQWDMYYDFIGPFFSGWTNYRLAEWYNILEIPKQPVSSVQGIWLRDSSGVETQLDPSMYNVSQTRFPARITINTWPFQEVLDYPYIEQLRIRFTSGYIAPCTVDTASDRITTRIPHGLNSTASPAYNAVRFFVSGGNVAGVMPSPLVKRTVYYAQVVNSTTFTLSTDPVGSLPVNLTSDPTGILFMSLQENGIPAAINRAILSVASRDRFASDPRSLRAIDAETDLTREARMLLKRFRRMQVY